MHVPNKRGFVLSGDFNARVVKSDDVDDVGGCPIILSQMHMLFTQLTKLCHLKE